jgi:hypothetical protein
VTNIEPDGDSRGVVIQIDLAGELQWRAALDTTASDTVEGVAVDPANGAVVAVGRTSGAFEGFVNQGQFDSFLAELDSGGRVSAIFQSGDERPQHPSRLSLGGSHLIAVAGFDDTYVTGHSVEAQEDGFVASFERGTEPTASFRQTLLQKVPLSQANRLTDVVADRDGSGSMYVTSFVSGPRASAGIFVKKLNSDGSPVWSTRISALTFDAVNAVGLSPSNELFVAGATGLSLGGPTAGGQDAFVSKIDKATGAILWTTQAGSSASDYPRALAFDELGNIYIAGETLGSVVGDPKLPGGTDVFAMKLNAAGTLISAWQTGTAENDFATSLVVDHCGRVLVGGYTKGALVENGHDPAGRDDMYVVRAAL